MVLLYGTGVDKNRGVHKSTADISDIANSVKLKNEETES